MRLDFCAINFFKLSQYTQCFVKLSLRYKPPEREHTKISKFTCKQTLPRLCTRF